MPAKFPTLETALNHVRERRELHKDEWFDTPKPVLIRAAHLARDWIARIDSSSHEVRAERQAAC
jgi:hypothetical protein